MGSAPADATSAPFVTLHPRAVKFEHPADTPTQPLVGSSPSQRSIHPRTSSSGANTLGSGSFVNREHPHRQASAVNKIVRKEDFMAVLYHKLRAARARRMPAT